MPIVDYQVQECGDFELDGVTFPAAEVPVSFIDPADGELFSPAIWLMPTVPKQLVASGQLPATLINAGIPTIFIRAEDLGYQGIELQEAINGDQQRWHV